MAVAETKILGLLQNIAKEQNLQNYDIKLSPISSGGANYLTNLFVATTITSEAGDDLELFIKFAAAGEKIRSNADFKIYEIENFIYTDLQAKFRKLEDEHGIVENDRLKMAKYYGASLVPREEIIVLENLVSKGFTCHDRMKSVNWDYAAAATRELAKLHALSMALEQEQPEEYVKHLEYFQFKTLDFAGMDDFFNNGKIAALNGVRKENYEKLKKFLDNMNFFKLWAHEKPKREVLIHGDFRPSNLMHRVQNDGSVEVIPVDYQTLRGGCPVVDLFYFIVLGTDQQFRAQYYEQLVDHYYFELRAALARLGLNPDEKYSREDFDSDLREKMQFGLGVAIFALPIVTVEAENAPSVSPGTDFTSFAAVDTIGSIYSERLNGVVDDFVRWGVL